MQRKRCSLCKVYKPFSEFSHHTGFRHGLDAWCKSCSKEKRQERYWRNRDKILQQQRRSQERNKEKNKAAHKRWYEEHKEAVTASAKRWKHNNPDKVYETTKRYRKSNPQKLKAHYAVSNAVRRGKIPSAGNFKCSICKTKQALDYHHYLGYEPEHYLDVQPTCRACHRKIG